MEWTETEFSALDAALDDGVLVEQIAEAKDAAEIRALVSGKGAPLSDGKPHDSRAPDYDDWSLNCDILVSYPLLGRAVELSSMGIRVDEESLLSQLRAAGCEDRAALPFHRELLAGKLPLTMGGGIGQSRLCMVLLGKAHIGEVQSSVWPEGMRETLRSAGIELL